jgi:hypothetical protein
VLPPARRCDARRQAYGGGRVSDDRSNEPSNRGRCHEFAGYKLIMARVPTYRQGSAFEAGWQEGELLALDAAVEFALAY